MAEPTLAIRPLRLAVLPAIYFFVTLVMSRPETVTPAGWRLFGIFAATVAGLMIQPLPGGALVLTGVLLSCVIGPLSINQALSGFAEPTVWLVQAAFFISRALINTGLARRIALFFVRLFGQSTLGVCYALSLSDLLLASIIPSNAARSGGIILPVARSIAELYGSKPGPTAALLGSFLMAAVYQSICVTSAMFLTGQASNPLVAKMASDYYQVTFTGWLVAGLVPGLLSMLLIPPLVLKLQPPSIRRTPEAAEFARKELAAMGPMQWRERVLAVVFVLVCALWVTSGWHKIDITVTALGGALALLLTGVLTWEDIKSEKSAWDILIWYGGLLMLGKALNETGVTTVFAKYVASLFAHTTWPYLFGGALLIYFYAHYAFASITSHVLAMYPPFLAALIASHAPPGLVVYSFACFVCFAAGLTTYGTTPAPMFFAQEYVTFRNWFRTGFVVSLLNLGIWGTVGFGWWKLLGIW